MKKPEFVQVVEAEAKAAGVTVAAVMRGERAARQAGMRAMVRLWIRGRSTTQIGQFFGRDHSTVVYAVAKWRAGELGDGLPPVVMIPEDQADWLIQHYGELTAVECAEYLGLRQSVVVEQARRLGLKGVPSKEYAKVLEARKQATTRREYSKEEIAAALADWNHTEVMKRIEARMVAAYLAGVR